MLVDRVELRNLPSKREHVNQSVDERSGANDCHHRKDLFKHQGQIDYEIITIPRTREEGD